MSQNYTNAWDRILHSAGEIVPASKLVNLSNYPMATLAAIMHDLFDRTDVGGYKSGVLFGLGCTPTANPLEVLVSAGSAFYSRVLGSQFVPCELETAMTVTCAAGGGAGHYDLIVVTPSITDTDIEAKIVKAADGSYSVQNLPQRQNFSAVASVVQGTAAAVPAVPSGSIPIAAVYVPAGFGGALAAWDGSSPPGSGMVADVRTWLSPLAGTSEYNAIVLGGGVGAQPTITAESVSDRSIGVRVNPTSGIHWARIVGPGGYLCEILTPRELLVSQVCVQATPDTVGPGFAAALGLVKAGTTATALFGGALNAWDIGFMYEEETGGGGTFFVINDMPNTIRMHVKATLIKG